MKTKDKLVEDIRTLVKLDKIIEAITMMILLIQGHDYALDTPVVIEAYQQLLNEATLDENGMDYGRPYFIGNLNGTTGSCSENLRVQLSNLIKDYENRLFLLDVLQDQVRIEREFWGEVKTHSFIHRNLEVAARNLVVEKPSKELILATKKALAAFDDYAATHDTIGKRLAKMY